MEQALSPDRIEMAGRTIDPVFLHSPLIRHDELDLRLGAHVVAKLETLNPIRSFKGRGTDWFVRNLPADAQALVTASAGNFGQGLAYAARKRGLPVTVFAAEKANALKIDAMRRLGADVRFSGADFDAAKQAAQAHAESSGKMLVVDGAHAAIADGAGTIAYELTAVCEVDAVIIPLGNGALLTGMGAWLRHAAPRVRVIGVVAEAAPAMRLSFLAGSAIETESASTIADGMAVRVPVSFALKCMPHTVDEVLTVDDATILRAMRLLHETLGVVVEPAGAAGLAAVLAYRSRFAGARLATVLCGGNLTPAEMREWL
jgi:threonine dehydratase